MLGTIKTILRLFSDTYAAWARDAAIQLGAAIAFYTALSLAPLLIFVFTLAGAILDAEAVEGELVTQTEEIAGRDAAGAVGSIIHQGHTIPAGTGIIGSIAGLISLILGASILFWQVKRALNTVWGIRRNPRSRVRGMLDILRGRLLASALVIGVGILLLASVMFDTSLSALRQWVAATMPELVQGIRILYVLQALKFAISFSLITFAIVIIYRILPNADVAWKDAWIGASITSLMLSIGNLGIGRYLATWSFRSAYGAAGPLLVFLIWVYFSAQVFFFGAEFTQVYANEYGSGIIPHKDTLLIIHRHRTQHDLTNPEGVRLALEKALTADEMESTATLRPDIGNLAIVTQPQAEYQKKGGVPQNRKRMLQYGGMLAATAALAIGVYYGVRRITHRQ